MIAGILEQAGLSTALFTSPHLHDYTERITIGGDHISREEFAAAISAIQPAIEAERESVHGEVSTFGILAALFFWLVRAQVPKVQVQVVEVGLGGTFDATNVIDPPEVAVITPISLEHTQILGNTCAKIAEDKAGIVKEGTTCVLAPQRDPAVVEVVRARCAAVGATLIDVGASYSWEIREKFPYGQSFLVRGPQGEREMRTPMLGGHQLVNATTAVAAAEALREKGVAIPDTAIADGVARTRVPGRLEVMSQRPLMVADGAHNAESAEALASALREYFQWRRCFLVIGTMQDKDVRSMGFRLARLAEMIVCTRTKSARAMDPYIMLQEVGFLGPMTVAEETVPAAIDTVLGHTDADDLVCVTGSLYTVAEAREYVLGEGAFGR